MNRKTANAKLNRFLEVIILARQAERKGDADAALKLWQAVWMMLANKDSELSKAVRGRIESLMA